MVSEIPVEPSDIPLGRMRVAKRCEARANGAYPKLTLWTVASRQSARNEHYLVDVPRSVLSTNVKRCGVIL